MPVDPISAAIGIGGSVIGGILGGGAARRAKRRAQKQVKKFERKLQFLENNRQEIINPYEGYQDVSNLTVDRSNQMSNAYANLSVATQAAEMKIEQADISLANTLDAIMATGAGAGGATALAKAAAQSKKEVAASIEQQEASNERMRAEGESSLENRRIQEKQRIEGVQMQEQQRLQVADAAGKTFQFNQRENREQMKIDRTAAELDNARMALAQAQGAQTSAFTGMLSGITNSFANAYTPKS